MKHPISLTILLLFINSCKTDKNNGFIGYWRLNYHDSIENSLIPFEVHLYGDSIKVVDGHNYSQIGRFTEVRDSMRIIFSNGSNSDVSVKSISDNVMEFAGERYSRIGKDDFTTVLDYELFGFVTNKNLKDNSNIAVLHLIRENDTPKVILNDVVSDLENIPNFLNGGHGAPPSIRLYVAKGITFMDLIETYNWILLSEIRNATLVLANEGFDKYYILNDKIVISNSLTEEFRSNNRILPPPPRARVAEDIRWNVLLFKDSSELSDFESLNDSANYLIQVNRKLEINDYLKLKSLIDGRPKIKVEITAYNKMYQ